MEVDGDRLQRLLDKSVRGLFVQIVSGFLAFISALIFFLGNIYVHDIRDMQSRINDLETKAKVNTVAIEGLKYTDSRLLETLNLRVVPDSYLEYLEKP